MRKTLWTKDYIYAVFVLFCVHLGPYMLLPVITVYGKLLSGSDTKAGMMASVFALSGLAARFLSAYLIEKLPLRRVLRIFTILMGAASLLYIFSASYWQAFVLRGIQGLAYGVTCTAMSTYIVNLLDPSDRLEGIGYSSLTGNLANAVCPSLSFMLLGENVDRFQWLFIGVFASVVLSFGAMLFMKPVETAGTGRTGRQNTSGLSGLLYFLALPFLMWLLSSFAQSTVSAFLSLYALEKGFGGIGLFFTFNIAGLICSRLSMQKITELMGKRNTTAVMIILVALCMFGIANMNALWQLYLIAFPFGFANGTLAPLINTLLVNSLPDEKAGLANAVFFAAGDAGFILGPTIWGMIARISSYHMVFMTAAFICVSIVIIPLCAKKELFG